MSIQSKRKFVFTLLFVSLILVSSCTDDDQNVPATNAADSSHPANPYLGQDLPGLDPVRFAPELIQTDGAELKVSFSPDGRLMLFNRLDPVNFRFQLFFMQNDKGVWSEPSIVPFSGTWDDGDSFFNSSGDKVYYLSKRPLENGETPTETAHLWYLPVVNNNFGEPRYVGLPDALVKRWWSSDLRGDNELYFTGRDDKDDARADIYMSIMENGQITQSKKLGPGINTDDYTENEPAIAPDGSYLIFYSAGRPDNLSNELTGDLYISFRQTDGSWSQAQNLGEPINSSKEENWPSISPDNRYLFFSSTRGEGKQFPDIYWVSLEFIENLKK